MFALVGLLGDSERAGEGAGEADLTLLNAGDADRPMRETAATDGLVGLVIPVFANRLTPEAGAGIATASTLF